MHARQGKFTNVLSDLIIGELQNAPELVRELHMVNFFRIRQYNAINLKYGFSTIDIRTPNFLKKAMEEFKLQQKATCS
jgi:hypothetical protein